MLRIFLLILFLSSGIRSSPQSLHLSPEQLVFNAVKNEIYILQKTAHRIDVFYPETGKITRSFSIKGEPNGMNLQTAEQRLIVASGAGEGCLTIINLNDNKIEHQIKTGHSLYSPIITADGAIVVCDRFAQKVHLIDTGGKKIIKSVDVAREPVSAVFDKEHNTIIVAHHLPGDAATDSIVSSKITFIDAEDFRVVKQVSMPNGSGSIKQIILSSDGKYGIITHILSRYTLHTTQLEQGWQNTNAISIVDLGKQEMYHTVLLDDVMHGAANPWAACFSEDGRILAVTHAGTNEISVIDFPGLLDKLKRYPATPGHYTQYTDPSNKLSFLYGLRKRIPLKGMGPRGICIDKNDIYISLYFSDALEHINIESQNSGLIPLTAEKEMDSKRRGEYLFHSAGMCFENWQSCSSCHPDSRIDGFNWDLLNDGIGNPKNVMSMLLSHSTPPSMSTGIRQKAETAVRAGLKFIQFTERGEDEALAIDEYLKSLKPVPSPYLKKGSLSHKANIGKKIFEKAGCANCHPAPLFTNLKSYNTGTTGPFDKTRDENGQIIPQTSFDTPTLIETWRTAPYLHDGRYKTLEELFILGNHAEVHSGKKSLTGDQIESLVEYIKSL